MESTIFQILFNFNFQLMFFIIILCILRDLKLKTIRENIYVMILLYIAYTFKTQFIKYCHITKSYIIVLYIELFSKSNQSN